MNTEAQNLQEGDFLDYTPAAAKTAGQVVQVAGRAGICATAIAALVRGSVKVKGVVKMRAAAVAGNAGGNIGWDEDGNPYGGTAGTGAATTTLSNADFLVGTLTKDLTATDGEAEIELNEFVAMQHRNYDIICGELLAGGVEQELCEVSTTQNYPIGTPRVMPNGDEAIYSKSSGVCWAGRGNKFHLAMSDGIDFTLLGANQAIGDKQVTFAAATHPAFLKDELKGGLLLISDQDVGSDQDKQVQQRVITGNDASLSGAACTVYFKNGLVRAVTTATYAFCMPSPYSSIKFGTDTGTSIAGIPASYISGSGKFFWLLKKVKMWIAPQDAVGKTAHSREVVFRHDGSLDIHDPTSATAKYQQHAGYIIDNNNAANGATFVQINL